MKLEFIRYLPPVNEPLLHRGNHLTIWPTAIHYLPVVIESHGDSFCHCDLMEVHYFIKVNCSKCLV